MRTMNVRLLLILAAFLAGCGKGHGPAKSAQETENKRAEAEAAPALPESVRLTSAAIAEAGIATWKVQAVDLEHLLSLNGSVGHDENRLLQIAANVKGRVAAIPVDLGTRVRKGDPVLVIESIDLGRAREEFVKELSSLNVATRSYERAKTLAEAKAISAGELQVREGDYLAKKAAVAAAERTLHLYGDTQEAISRLRDGVESHDPYPSAAEAATLALRAPFSGRVLDRKVTPGSLFEALQPLVTIADLSTVWVFLQAYEKDLALLREGLPVTIRTEAYPQETFHGRVDFLGGIVDEKTRTVRVRATVENRTEKLRPGMFVKAQVDVPRPKTEAHAVLAVPQAALQMLEGRTTVFVETEPGVFVRRLVETGHTFEGFTEVLSGMKRGDLIVTEGSFVLKSEFAKASLAKED
jgi:cobalt-zinc-cadmium efflux system membrane fusion protein